MKGCSLSKKQISAILYYFDENFRKNIGTPVAQKSNQFISTTPTSGAVVNACTSFYRCYYATDAKNDMMTSCQEKFTFRYKDGMQRKQNTQTIQTVQVGEDKFRNTSLEDSPYDLMYDISAISKILFESIQEPYQLAFYHLPNRKGNSGNGAETQ
ncbi:MAG: hypothetical protein LBU27_08285 [Candidatus Peribacteria bacterium]|jgi:hypothetical protein|nr:hypothetical protein [Candidatus Peribacteria bacterium]